MKIQARHLKPSRLLAALLPVLFIFFVGYVSASPYTMWRLPEGTKARLNKGGASRVVYSPDGTLLAVASNIGIWLYDAQTGEERNLLTRHKESVINILFSSDGQMLASGYVDTPIRLWDVNTGRILRTFRGHTRDVECVVFSPDGLTLASGSSDGTVLLWDLTPE